MHANKTKQTFLSYLKLFILLLPSLIKSKLISYLQSIKLFGYYNLKPKFTIVLILLWILLMHQMILQHFQWKKIPDFGHQSNLKLFAQKMENYNPNFSILKKFLQLQLLLWSKNKILIGRFQRFCHLVWPIQLHWSMTNNSNSLP